MRQYRIGQRILAAAREPMTTEQMVIFGKLLVATLRDEELEKPNYNKEWIAETLSFEWALDRLQSI